MNVMKGILHVTGEHDTGKTTFALECGASPDRICFLDDDEKGRATVEEFRDDGNEFGAYYNLTLLQANKQLMDFHLACLDVIDNIEEGRFDAIIWDTWTRFATTCGVYVKARPNEFRAPSEWSSMGRIKGAEMNKEGTLYEATIIAQLAERAPTVILVTHLKNQYINNADTGKEIPASSRTPTRVSRMRIWLRQNPDGRPVPIGLFLKRFDRKIIDERGRIRTVCVVPRKIVPAQEDGSLWDTIERYWENPVGTRPPTPEETPNEFELSILDGTLTADQRRTLNLMLQAGAVESRNGDGGKTTPVPPMLQQGTSLKNKIAALAAQGKSVSEIAKEVGRPAPVVQAMMK